VLSTKVLSTTIRRDLYPIQKEAKRQGKRVALIRDRLYIENELYVPAEEIDEAGDFDSSLGPQMHIMTHMTHKICKYLITWVALRLIVI
jgi:hypothetical protein